MAYNEILADRIRESLIAQKDIIEKEMFGGIAFMLKDKMFCGIVKDDLMVRILEDVYEESLSEPYCRPMDFTGGIMKGFVFVSADGINSQKKLAAWLEKGIDFALKAPSKKVATKKLLSKKKTAPKKTKSKKRSPKRKSKS